jgi:hypothetical protein
MLTLEYAAIDLCANANVMPNLEMDLWNPETHERPFVPYPHGPIGR